MCNVREIVVIKYSVPRKNERKKNMGEMKIRTKPGKKGFDDS